MATVQEEIAQLEAARQEGTDIFAQQQQIINGLNDVLLKLESGKAGGTAYVQQVPQPVESAPNYMLYIAIGLGVLLLLFKGKIL